MIKVERYNDNVGTQIKFKFKDGKKLNFNFGSDLNFYFTPEVEEDKEICLFDIDPKEDEELYYIFDSLYTKITKYMPTDEVDRKFKKQDKNSVRPLVQDGIIEWVSDEMPMENASRMIVYKQSGKLQLFFEEGKIDENNKTKSVRINTKNSRYGKFFIPFIELYGNICAAGFEDHQITIDEYLLQRRYPRK